MKYFIGILSIAVFLVIFIVLNKKNINKVRVLEYIFLFILGCLACYVTNKIENKVGGYFPSMKDMKWYMVFIYAIFGVSLYEEGLKWFFTLTITFREKVSKLEMITYSVICSLGFAFLESIVYYIAYSDVSGAISRGITSIPSHVCFAVIMGLLLWYGLNNKNIKRIIYLLLSCLIPIIIHALYNVFLYKEISSLYIYSVILLIIIEVISVIIVIKCLKE